MMNKIKEARIAKGIDTETMALNLTITKGDYERMEGEIEDANAFLCKMVCCLLNIDFKTL